MTINFVVSDLSDSGPGVAETFSLVAADQTAFPRLFPWSLTAFKNGIATSAPGFNLGDPAIRVAALAIIQAGLIGGGSSVGAAVTRANAIKWKTSVQSLTVAILADAGA